MYITNFDIQNLCDDIINYEVIILSQIIIFIRLFFNDMKRFVNIEISIGFQEIH